LLKSHIADT